MKKVSLRLLLVGVISLVLLVGLVVIFSHIRTNTVPSANASNANFVATTVPIAVGTPLSNLPPVRSQAEVQAAQANQGVAGIKVQSGIKGNVPNVLDLDTINISENDVRQFVKTQPLTGIMFNKNQVNVDKVEFIPRSAVNARLHGDSLDLPDAKMLCFVTLSGSFKALGAPDSFTFSKAYVVFNPGNGNLLMSGELK
jgi:hypothetical protein